MSNFSDRSSVKSASTTGGYETPDEELPAVDRAVRFESIIDENDEIGDSAAADHLTDDVIDRKSFRRLKRPKLGKGLAARIFRKFPRCYSFLIGMVCPLWFLVLLSLIGGKILAAFEFDGEVEANNAAMRRRVVQKRYNELVDHFERHSPAFCLILYKKGLSAENVTNMLGYLLDTSETGLEDFVAQGQQLIVEEGSISIDNVTSFSKYLNECGAEIDNYTNNIHEEYFGGTEEWWAESSSLSFNWIRCVNVSWTTPNGFNRIFQPTQEYIDAAHPLNQSKAFSETWIESQQAIRDQYYDMYRLEEGTSVANARLRSFNNSIYEASGGSSCDVNVPSAAWFWFTIMATVGYGNQSPATLAGRMLVFTFGFLSILCFGAVLATSGTITTHLVEDFVIRLKFRIFANKIVMALVWGLLWIGLLFVIAGYAMQWNMWRMDEKMSLEEGIWFAYISTTTIGLGDFYPAPEVMFPSDLLVYTLLFLFGFVLLSSFLTEISYILGGIFPDLGTELAKRLKFVGILPCKGRLHGPRDDFEPDFDLSNSHAAEPDIPPLPEAPIINGALGGKEDGELKTVKSM